MRCARRNPGQITHHDTQGSRSPACARPAAKQGPETGLCGSDIKCALAPARRTRIHEAFDERRVAKQDRLFIVRRKCRHQLQDLGHLVACGLEMGGQDKWHFGKLAHLSLYIGSFAVSLPCEPHLASPASACSP